MPPGATTPLKRCGAERPNAGAYTEVVISNINVTNGTAEIGFFSNDPSGNNSLLYVDDVTFYKQ